MCSNFAAADHRLMHDIDFDARVFWQFSEDIVAHIRQPAQAFRTAWIDQEHQPHKALVPIEILTQRLIVTV